MLGKPDLFILSGAVGKKVYDHICNAKPPKEPLYTKEEARKFEESLLPHLDEIAKAMEVETAAYGK